MDDVSDKITLAHISETVGKLTESQARIENKLDPESDDYILGPVNTKLNSWVEVRDGAFFLKKIIIGSASIAVALSMIGGSIIWLINYIRHG